MTVGLADPASSLSVSSQRCCVQSLGGEHGQVASVGAEARAMLAADCGDRSQPSALDRTAGRAGSRCPSESQASSLPIPQRCRRRRHHRTPPGAQAAPRLPIAGQLHLSLGSPSVPESPRRLRKAGNHALVQPEATLGRLRADRINSATIRECLQTSSASPDRPISPDDSASDRNRDLTAP
jgi:hypothetical protein